jgi:hypothetical protein
MEVSGQLHTLATLPWYSLDGRLGGPKGSVNPVEKRKIFFPCPELSPDSSACCYAGCTISAPNMVTTYSWMFMLCVSPTTEYVLEQIIDSINKMHEHGIAITLSVTCNWQDCGTWSCSCGPRAGIWPSWRHLGTWTDPQHTLTTF